MAYQIIGVNEINANITPSIGLGVSFSSTSPIFKSIYLTTEQAIENLKTLLLTRVGERYMEPNFGTNLLYVVFEPNVSQIKQEISDIITSALSHWLPYIEIDDLTIVTAEDDPNLQYNIQITLVFSVNGFDTKSITLSADNNGQLIVS
jgi:phage baseplate assembly protein W